MTQHINLNVSKDLEQKLMKHKECGDAFDAYAVTGDLIMAQCSKCNTRDFIELSFHPTETEGYDILTL